MLKTKYACGHVAKKGDTVLCIQPTRELKENKKYTVNDVSLEPFDKKHSKYITEVHLKGVHNTLVTRTYWYATRFWLIKRDS